MPGKEVRRGWKGGGGVVVSVHVCVCVRAALLSHSKEGALHSPGV